MVSPPGAHLIPQAARSPPSPSLSATSRSTFGGPGSVEAVTLCPDCMKPKAEHRNCPETGRPHVPGASREGAAAVPKSRRSSFGARPAWRSGSPGEDRQEVATSTSGEPEEGDHSSHGRRVSISSDTENRSRRPNTAGSHRERGKSLASQAFDQILRNRAFQSELDYGIATLNREIEEMEEFTELRQSWTESPAFKLEKFKLDCINALTAKKAAGKMIGKVRTKATRTEHKVKQRRHKLEHRSVMRKGPLGARFKAAARLSELQGSAAVALLRGSSDTQSFAESVAPGRVRPMHRRPRTAPPRRPAAAAAVGGHPGESVLDVEQRLAVAGTRSTNPMGPIIARRRDSDPTEEEKWAERKSRLLRARPGLADGEVTDTRPMEADDSSPQVRAGSRAVDWGQMLDVQSRDMMALEASDGTYRRMLHTFQEYQTEVHRRLDVLLAL